jgi:hypothetical protein
VHGIRSEQMLLSFLPREGRLLIASSMHRCKCLRMA